MRIGLLTTSFPREERDIAGRFVLGFARALVGRGHTLEVLAPEPATLCPVPRWPGIEARHVPYLRPRALQRTFYGAGALDNLARDPRAWLGVAPFPLALALACHGRAPRWDAVVSHFALPCALVASSHARGLPHLAVLHSADLHLLARIPAGALMARRIARSATRLWLVSSAHRTRFLSLLPARMRDEVASRTHVGPMGIDPLPAALPARDAARKELAVDRFTALTLGRLVPVKDLERAITAVAHLGATLLVAGDGPEREKLEAHARSCRADVRFLGTVLGAEKERALSAADAFVVCSRTLPGGRSEGVPVALLEAMLRGLPAIATRVGGIPDLVVDGETGLLVPERDASALQAALRRLAAQPALRSSLGDAGRALAARHGWPALAQTAETLVCEGAPRRAHDQVRAPAEVLTGPPICAK